MILKDQTNFNMLGTMKLQIVQIALKDMGSSRAKWNGFILLENAKDMARDPRNHDQDVLED